MVWKRCGLPSTSQSAIAGSECRLAAGSRLRTDCSLMALSAQIGYIVPLISMLQLNSEIIKKVDCYMLGIHTMKHYNKQLFNLGFAGKTLQHKRYHESSNIQG